MWRRLLFSEGWPRRKAGWDMEEILGLKEPWILVIPETELEPYILRNCRDATLDVWPKPSAAHFKKAMAVVCNHWSSGFTSAHRLRAHFPWEVPALPEHGRALGSPTPSRLIWQSIFGSELPAELLRLWARRCEAPSTWTYSQPPSYFSGGHKHCMVQMPFFLLFVFLSWELPHKPLILSCLAKQAFPWIYWINIFCFIFASLVELFVMVKVIYQGNWAKGYSVCRTMNYEPNTFAFIINYSDQGTLL